MRRLFIHLLMLLVMLVPGRVFAMGVSPAFIDLSLARGAVGQGEITVTNDSTRSRTFFLSTLKFMPQDDSGSPEFVPFAADHAGFPEWIVFPNAAVQLAAGASKAVPFRVAIPEDAEAGGHYAAITVSDTPAGTGSAAGTGVSSSVAVLLFLTVDGENVRKLSLVDVTPEGSSVSRELNAAFTVRVKNEGNVHVIPQMRSTARNIFGMEVASATVSSNDFRVLPQQTRSFPVSLKIESASVAERALSQLTSLAFGPISVTTEVATNGGDVERQSFWLFVIPVELLAGADALIALGLIAGFLRKPRQTSA